MIGWMRHGGLGGLGRRGVREAARFVCTSGDKAAAEVAAEAAAKQPKKPNFVVLSPVIIPFVAAHGRLVSRRRRRRQRRRRR